MSAGNRPLEPGVGDDDMVCGLDVCEELDEYPSAVHVKECDTDEVTGATLLGEDVAKARAEEITSCEKFKAHAQGTDETNVSRTGREINKGDSERVEVRRRSVARENKQKGNESYFAGTPPLVVVRYVISRAATRTKTGRRRQLLVHDTKRSFRRRTDRDPRNRHTCETLNDAGCKRSVCTAHSLRHQDGNTLFRK